MRLIVVSGLSGSGKSVALDMLEDLDFYCVDNIPAGLLPGFIAYTVRTSETSYRQTAVGLDVRNVKTGDVTDSALIWDSKTRSLRRLAAEASMLSSMETRID